MDTFLDSLNDVQREAVCYNSGPSLVVAGAGSGKTRVLTYKIAELISDGVLPYSILALTFTNKAAREMKERIAKLVGDDNARRLWMGTFHSIFSRILRKEAETLGFQSNFSIYATSDSNNLLKSIIKERKLDDKIYSVKKVSSRISQMKNDLITPAIYRGIKEYHDVDLRQRMPLFSELFQLYFERCKRANAMDFDDLLLYTSILFREHPEVLAKYQNIFKFILVDEYQDTNHAQFEIVQRLARKNNKVCVVGDDAQSIYSFRGARIENILKFKDQFSDCRIFKLEQNYRSTKNIVKVASSLISKNKKQIPKNVFSVEKDGNKVSVVSSYSEIDESTKVANILMTLKSDMQCSYSDFAILYRTNAQSRSFEDVFRKKGIPYRIYGSTSFYERKEILDVLAYYRLIINSDDDEAFKRILNYPTRGIGDTTLTKIVSVSNLNNTSCWKVISDPLTYALPVSVSTLSKIGEFQKMISGFIAEKDDIDAYELGTKVVHNSGIWTFLKSDVTPEGMSRVQNVEELMNSLSSAAAQKQEMDGESYMLSDFMSEVALMTSQDVGETEDKVTMMTVHAAKGLEYKNVFVVGVEEELFPSSMSTGSEDGIEEERRLFYVAITRAEENCVLTYSKSRMRNGSYNQTNPSRFLKDIDLSLLDFSEAPDYEKIHARILGDDTLIQKWEDNRPRHDFEFKVKPKERPHYNFGTTGTPITSMNKFRKLTPVSNNPRSILNLPKFDYSSLREGSEVEHPQFGLGSILKIYNKSMPEAKMTVLFKSVGEKTLMLKYVHLRILKA